MKESRLERAFSKMKGDSSRSWMGSNLRHVRFYFLTGLAVVYDFHGYPKFLGKFRNQKHS